MSLHFPVTVEVCGEPTEASLARLALQVQRAVSGRIAAAERELPGRVQREGGRTVAPASGALGEAATGDRRGPGLLGSYLVPSYDRGGALVSLPVAGPEHGDARPSDDPSAALRKIHELLHPGFLHGSVAPSEAVSALRLLQALSPVGRVDALSRMRLSQDLGLLGRLLPAAERPALDALVHESDPATGVIMVGDLLRVRLISGQAVPEHEADAQVDGSGGVRLPMLTQPVHVAGLSPAQAADAIAQAYFDGDIYRVLTVTVSPARRGRAYGSVTVPSAIEARSTVSSRAAGAPDPRMAEFLNHARAIRPADIGMAAALNRYYEQLRGDLSRWRSPAELWAWALAQHPQPVPESPLRAYLSLHLSLSAQAATASGEERARMQQALSDYIAWVSAHADDPRLGTPGYAPADVYARSYIKALRADVARSVVRAQEKRAEQLEADRWAQVGSALDAALEYLKRQVWRAPEPEIAEDPQRLVGYLITPSAAELLIRQTIGRQYLDDLMDRAGSATFPTPAGIPADFQSWLRRRPELYKAFLVTSSHPDVEKYQIDIPAWQTAREVIVGLLPIIGQIVGAKEAITGEDLSGHELGTTERTIIAVTLLLPALGKLYKGGRALMAADEMIRVYGLSSREAAFTYRMAVGLGPGSHAASLFSRVAAEVRAGSKITDPQVLGEMEQVLKDLGMTDQETVRALSERPGSLLHVDPAVEADVERALAETPGVGTSGLFPTTQRLIRGNLGEKLAADALAHDGHIIISYKPGITGTNQGGVDIVTFRGGLVYLVDNKALTRAGNIASVSSLTTNLTQNIAAVRGELRAMLVDAARTPAERVIVRNALTALDQGLYVKAVTNGNVARSTQILTGVTANLSNQGIQFINVFP